MTGEELAFWLMMAFSCSIGVFVGYLLFAPSRSAKRANGFRGAAPDDDDDFYDDDEPALQADTGVHPEPYLEESQATRAAARQLARQRLEQHRNQQQMHAQAAASKDGQAVAAANDALAAKTESFLAGNSIGPGSTSNP